MKHTPTPWVQDKWSIRDSSGKLIAFCDSETWVEMKNGSCNFDGHIVDAAFIVQAVNAHDKLVEALSLISGLDLFSAHTKAAKGCDLCKAKYAADGALALAKGEK